MFDRSKSDIAETSGVSVVLTLTDGTELKGRLAVPGRALDGGHPQRDDAVRGI